MGGAEVRAAPPVETEEVLQPRSLSEELDELCAFYMSIGVPYEEFWNGDYCQLKYHIKRYEIEKDRENQKMYIMGAYVFDALMATLQNFHLDGKHHQPVYYRKEPFDLNPKVEEEETPEKIRQQRQQIVDQLNAWMENYERSKVKQIDS